MKIVVFFLKDFSCLGFDFHESSTIDAFGDDCDDDDDDGTKSCTLRKNIEQIYKHSNTAKTWMVLFLLRYAVFEQLGIKTKFCHLAALPRGVVYCLFSNVVDLFNSIAVRVTICYHRT